MHREQFDRIPCPKLGERLDVPPCDRRSGSPRDASVTVARTLHRRPPGCAVRKSTSHAADLNCRPFCIVKPPHCAARQGMKSHAPQPVTPCAQLGLALTLLRAERAESWV